MSSERHYRNAPITEAIIAFKVLPSIEEKLSLLKDLHIVEKGTYPRQDLIFEALGVMQFQPGGTTSASAQHKQTGFKYTSEDGRLIWQAQLNGFSFHHLAPYDSWVPFRDEARRLWGAFRNAMKPEQVSRVAVRYINRIDIPETPIDLKDFFRTSPEIAPELPQTMNGFFMQLRLPQSEIGGELLLSQTIIPPPREGLVSVVLDIDLFRESDIPQNEAQLWEFFETMHERKNDVFEACITNRTRELFE